MAFQWFYFFGIAAGARFNGILNWALGPRPSGLMKVSMGITMYMVVLVLGKTTPAEISPLIPELFDQSFRSPTFTNPVSGFF